MSPLASRTATQLTAAAQTILFDFDGPICNFFSGLPNPYAADRLREVLRNNANVQLSDHLATTSDSFDILRATPQIAPALTDLVEGELTAVERRAATLSTPTPGAFDALSVLRGSGKTIAIVSNTAESAILLYLDSHGLHPYVHGVFGRVSSNPSLLKPSPHLVIEALGQLQADPETTVLVGDQPTDIEAARRAGIASIGYANKPGKDERLRTAGATAIVDHMADIIAPSLVTPAASTRHREVRTREHTTRDRAI